MIHISFEIKEILKINNVLHRLKIFLLPINEYNLDIIFKERLTSKKTYHFFLKLAIIDLSNINPIYSKS